MDAGFYLYIHMKKSGLFLLLVFLFAACQPSGKGNEEPNLPTENTHTAEPTVWTYEGDRGPEDWANIHSEYRPCADGKHQSPVNLMVSGVPQEHMFSFAYSSTSEMILNNGHTVELLYDSGSIFSFDGTDYSLLQFHFHTPSEHQLNGDEFPIEMHLVHRSVDTTYLVVSILFEEGAENPFLSHLILDAPEEVEQKNFDTTINVSELLPEEQEFYYYSGSFTTPPCTESVKWLVFKEQITASPLQIKALRAIEGANSRPVQELNDREVAEVVMAVTEE